MGRQEILHIIKTTVHSFFPDAQILLFGSRAREESHLKSDYDLLIVTRDTYPPRVKMAWENKIRKTLVNSLRVPFDVIINSNSEISEKRNLHGHIVYYAMKEAVEI